MRILPEDEFHAKLIALHARKIINHTNSCHVHINHNKDVELQDQNSVVENYVILYLCLFRYDV
jgi:hypothetical protein